MDVTKQGCQLCHQMGNRFTFDVSHLDGVDSTVEAWDHRVTVGQRGAQMSNVLNRFGRGRALEMLPTGLIGSPPARCRPRRLVRRASSETLC